jgi:hypothetical protein
MKGVADRVRADGDTRDEVFGGGRSRCYVDAQAEVGGGCSEVIVR